MDYIVSHINTDFDSLASMVAASKLYPNAKMVFSGKLNNEVKAFMSFYKDIFPVFPMNQVNFTKVKRIIIVDTMLQKRIGKLGDLVGSAELHIYDHHVDNEDLKGQVHQVEALGATVTMLVEKIKEEAVELSPIEATLLLLGIYSDTDCLTYPSTTARDAYAAAYLLGLGANLQIVRDFLGRPLEEMQKDILNTLLNSLERYEFNGSNVLIASAECEDYVEGLSILAFKIQDIENPDALFIVAKMGKRVHIVGRSKVDEVSVRDILEPFGGGGHQKAASAVIKNGDLNDIKAKLHDAIVKNAKPMYTARDLMSSPVKTIPPEMTIQQADRIMIRYGHTGVPIVDQAGKMQGIISRRDIDKARQHGLLNHPVKGFMSSNIVTITPDTNFQEIQKLIIEHDIGRLPVLDDGYIVGIVSRTDVLRSLYAGEHKPEKKPENSNFYLWRNVSSIMERDLKDEIQNLLCRIGQVGDEENTPVYVVGGFVRDLLMKRPNLDIDLVVEGNGAEFAAVLAQKLGGEKTFESEFCTAQIMLPSGLKLDVATARREFYEYPAMLPQVEEGSLKQDLYRRDFTINAMAVQLNPQSYGDLIDFFGGQRDIYQKKIRVLYNLSFIEDPTRILRALRFEKRYNFTIEPETEFFIKQALKIDVLRQVSSKRLAHEFMLIAGETKAGQIMKRADELGVLKSLHSQLHLDRETYQFFNKGAVSRYILDIEAKDRLVFYTLLMIYKLDKKHIAEICSFLHFTEGQQAIIWETIDNFPAVQQVLAQEELSSSELYQALNGYNRLSLIFFLFKAKSFCGYKRMIHYLDKLAQFKTEITGKDLIALGFKPGPDFGRTLETVKMARMDKKINSKEEELNLAESLLCAKIIERRG